MSFAKAEAPRKSKRKNIGVLSVIHIMIELAACLQKLAANVGGFVQPGFKTECVPP